MKRVFGALVAILLGVGSLILPAWGAYDLKGTVERVSVYGTRVASGDTAISLDSSRNLNVAVASGTITTTGGSTGSVGTASGNYALGRTNAGAAQYLNMDLAGNLLVTLQASSSTIGAVTQSAGPWTVIGAATGSVAAVNGLGILGRTAAGVFQWFRLGTDDALRIDPTGTTTQPVSGTFWQATQPVSGTVTANAGTGNFSVVPTATGSVSTGNVMLAGARNLTGNADYMSLTANGLKVDNSAVTQPVSGTFWQATQPVSGTVTANIGASTSLPIAVTEYRPDGTGNPKDYRTPTVANINVTTSATQLLAAPPTKQVGMCFTPMDTEVRFGPSGVTWDTGFPVAASQSMCIDVYAGGNWYGIRTSGTGQVRVLTVASN